MTNIELERCNHIGSSAITISGSMSISHNTFLGIPLEVRWAIYESYLKEHQRVNDRRQPSNVHIIFLSTCRQIRAEAGALFQQYISFKYPRQWIKFYDTAPEELATQVVWVDAANDGRVVTDASKGNLITPSWRQPMSRLYLALNRLKNLKHLRVFDDSRSGLVQTHNFRYWWAFEEAMYPKSYAIPQLEVYSLYVGIQTKNVPFLVIPPSSIHTLRLSGHSWLNEPPLMPNLRHLSLHTVTGNFFDLMPLTTCFPDCQLESFFYAKGHMMGFDIRDHHLHSLAYEYKSEPALGSRLRKLVLLGCSKLSSTTLVMCLERLRLLEYFAVSLITVDELDGTFVSTLAPTLSVLKLQLFPGRFKYPLERQERELCTMLEAHILQRGSPLEAVYINFREELMAEDGRQERWLGLAGEHRFALNLGPWEEVELSSS